MPQEMSDDIKQVFAIGRLFEFSSKKRFHLRDNEFIDDEIGKKALKINNDIKTKFGIDLFETTDEKDLIEYQRILNQYISIHYNQAFIVPDIVKGL